MVPPSPAPEPAAERRPEPVAPRLQLLARARQLGRRGHLAQARELIDQAASADAAQPVTPEWRARLALAEGVQQYFVGDHAAVDDHLQQALQQAGEAGMPSLQADALALAALQSQHLQQPGRAAQQAAQALRLAGPDDHDVRYRCWLLLGNLCQTARDGQRAFALYRRALEAARAGDDSIGTAVTIARMALVQAGGEMSRHLHGEHDPEALRQAVVGLQSGLKLQQQAGVTDLAIDQLMLGFLLRLQGRPTEAEALFASWRDRFSDPERPLLPLRVDVEWALCRLAAGDTEGARARADAAARVPGQPAGSSELLTRAALLHGLAQVWRALGDVRADEVAELARVALAAHEAQIAHDRTQLDAWLQAAEIGA